MTRAVVFAYSEVGFRCLRVLLDQGVTIPLLFTHADDPGENRWWGSVQDLARAAHLRVETPVDPNTPEWIAAGQAAGADFLFSFYYRHMLSAGWLGVARQGALNMHGSLLPRYRGRAPVHWAILNGETETGASLHYMVAKPDAGALVDQQSVPILPDDNALAVSLRVAAAAETVLARSLPGLIAGSAAARPPTVKILSVSFRMVIPLVCRGWFEAAPRRLRGVRGLARRDDASAGNQSYLNRANRD